MRMRTRLTNIPPLRKPPHTRKPRSRNPPLHRRHCGRRIDAVPRITIIEIRIPARKRGDESGRSEQRAVWLTGRDVDAGWGAGEVLVVEDVGCEGAAAVGGGGDGGELGGVEGGGEVHVCFEEFGAAAIVEVEGGEDDVDAGGLPVGGIGVFR